MDYIAPHPYAAAERGSLRLECDQVGSPAESSSTSRRSDGKFGAERSYRWALVPTTGSGSRSNNCRSFSATSRWRAGPNTQTAGLTFVPERSSNGKATRTTLPLTGQRLSVVGRVDVFGGIVQESERWIASRCLPPSDFGDLIVGNQDDHAHPPRAYEVERLVEVQHVPFVDVTGNFDGLHAVTRHSNEETVHAQTVMGKGHGLSGREGQAGFDLAKGRLLPPQRCGDAPLRCARDWKKR